jgi:hypothetical protein
MTIRTTTVSTGIIMMNNAGVGKNDRPQAATPGTASVINVESKDSVRTAFGDANDKHVIKSYTFTTDEAAGNKFAKLLLHSVQNGRPPGVMQIRLSESVPCLIKTENGSIFQKSLL